MYVLMFKIRNNLRIDRLAHLHSPTSLSNSWPAVTVLIRNALNLCESSGSLPLLLASSSFSSSFLLLLFFCRHLGLIVCFHTSCERESVINPYTSSFSPLCHSFGYCEKDMYSKQGKTHRPIGRYGNGFKSGSMRLAKDALVFTVHKKSGTASIGLLSLTFLEDRQANSVLIPMVEYTRRRHILNPCGTHKAWCNWIGLIWIESLFFFVKLTGGLIHYLSMWL